MVWVVVDVRGEGSGNSLSLPWILQRLSIVLHFLAVVCCVYEVVYGLSFNHSALKTF